MATAFSSVLSFMCLPRCVAPRSMLWRNNCMKFYGTLAAPAIVAAAAPRSFCGFSLSPLHGLTSRVSISCRETCHTSWSASRVFSFNYASTLCTQSSISISTERWVNKYTPGVVVLIVAFLTPPSSSSSCLADDNERATILQCKGVRKGVWTRSLYGNSLRVIFTITTRVRRSV